MSGIRKARRAAGYTIESAAEMLDISPGYYSRLERGERRGLTKDRLKKLADLYKCDISALFSEQSEDEKSGENNTQACVFVVGHVQAGDWREAIEWQAEDKYPLSLPRKMVDGWRVFGLEVRGPSMNMMLRPGSVVICVRVIDYDQPIESGDLVVVERRAPDGHIEATVKQLVVSEGEAWLWPRSDSPDHQQPIRIPWPFDPLSRDDPHTEVAISAVVVMDVNPRKKPRFKRQRGPAA